MMKSAKLEWQLGCLQKALDLLTDGVKEYGDFAKVKVQQSLVIYDQIRNKDSNVHLQFTLKIFVFPGVIAFMEFHCIVFYNMVILV